MTICIAMARPHPCSCARQVASIAAAAAPGTMDDSGSLSLPALLPAAGKGVSAAEVWLALSRLSGPKSGHRGQLTMPSCEAAVRRLRQWPCQPKRGPEAEGGDGRAMVQSSAALHSLVGRWKNPGKRSLPAQMWVIRSLPRPPAPGPRRQDSSAEVGMGAAQPCRPWLQARAAHFGSATQAWRLPWRPHAVVCNAYAAAQRSVW